MDAGDPKGVCRAMVSAGVQRTRWRKTVGEGEDEGPDGHGRKSETGDEAAIVAIDDPVPWEAEVHVREADNEDGERDPTRCEGPNVGGGHERGRRIEEREACDEQTEPAFRARRPHVGAGRDPRGDHQPAQDPGVSACTRTVLGPTIQISPAAATSPARKRPLAATTRVVLIESGALTG